MIARTSRVCAAHLVAIFVAVLSSFAAGQNTYSAGGQGTIPNECCPETSALSYMDGWYGDGFDAGTGLTDVTLHGTVERKIPMPPIESGLAGVAGLYHRTFVLDVTSSAWGGTYVNLKGGNIPVPVLDPTKLVGGEEGLQPRPGNMPGLYLYTDGGGGSGSSSGSKWGNSGRSVRSNGDDDLKRVKAKKAPPTAAAMVYTNNLSGSQLWHYYAANPAYFEVKHVDGSVARYDTFSAWSTTTGIPANAGMMRVTSVRDPYDNKADYIYDVKNRLEEIRFPSGLTQKFDWVTIWAGWNANDHDCLAISYSQDRFTGQGAVALPERTWGIAFNRLTLRRHFGSRVFRIYSPARKVVHDVVGSAYASPPASTTASVIHELECASGSTSVLSEYQKLDAGSTFARYPTAPIGLPDQHLVSTGFAGIRALFQTRPMSGETLQFTYPTQGIRSQDLLPTVGTMRAIAVQDTSGSSRRFEFDRDKGHLYSVIFSPSTDFVGSPRKTHAATENSGIGGVASTAVEPERYEIYNVFDSTCVCQKPIERRIISTISGQSPVTRTMHFVYDSTSKLLTERREPNPETGGTAEVVWKYTYSQAKDASSQAWELG